MNYRKTLIAVATFVVVCVAVWLLTRGGQPEKVNPQTPKTQPTPAASPSASPTYLSTTAPRQEPGGPYAPADPRWPERTRKLKADPQYEWKTPIEFYGKVVDQDGEPVSGVEVKMNWTDMSPEGTSEAQRTTDASGLFSITGIQGKNFGVIALEKEGYVPFSKSNPNSFEYAGFWEPSYHIPDKENPVIFRLRKKGEAAVLANVSGKIVLEFGKAVTIPMPREMPSSTVLKVTVFENIASPRKWNATVSVEGGGVVPTIEEFPFEAPEQGYQSSLDLNQSSPHPPGWQDLFQGGQFYIKTDNGYGLLKLEQTVGKKTLRYSLALNLKGDRNLESEQR
jgi:hypothetical protein